MLALEVCPSGNLVVSWLTGLHFRVHLICLLFKLLVLIICNFSTAATCACGEHVSLLVLAHVQSLNIFPCILPNVQNVTQSTSVNVASCSMFYPLQVCYIKLTFIPSPLYCFLKNILYLLLQFFWDVAKLFLNHVVYLFDCYRPFTKNFHGMNHLLLAAIYTNDRTRNAVFLTLLNIQRGLPPRHIFSHRLHMLLGKIILFPASCVYWFVVFMINLQLECMHSDNPIGSLSHARFKLAQQKPQKLHASFTSSQMHDVHLLEKSHSKQMGGGSGPRHHEYASIEAYVVSSHVPDVQSKPNVCYVSHVDDVGLLAYPSPAYVHTSMPLSSLIKLIILSDARKIAAVHGMSVGSRCTVAQLILLVKNHSCLKCSSYISVFKFSELNVNQLSAKRSKKYRGKKSQSCHNPVSTSQSASPQFPPNPASDNLEHLILTNACKKMQPEHFTKAGCAVCSELKVIP